MSKTFRQLLFTPANYSFKMFKTKTALLLISQLILAVQLKAMYPIKGPLAPSQLATMGTQTSTLQEMEISTDQSTSTSSPLSPQEDIRNFSVWGFVAIFCLFIITCTAIAIYKFKFSKNSQPQS